MAISFHFCLQPCKVLPSPKQTRPDSANQEASLSRAVVGGAEPALVVARGDVVQVSSSPTSSSAGEGAMEWGGAEPCRAGTLRGFYVK